MSGHTAGPWHTNGDGIVRCGTPPLGFLGIKIGSPWREGCWCDEDADAETLANARLIAAAPDLLAAGTAVMETIDAQYRAGIRWDPDQIEALRAAIAKATGNV